MTRYLPRITAAWYAVLTAALLLNGCATSPKTRFYLLTPMADQAVGAPGAAVPAGSTLAVRQVHLPSYLERPQIVTQTDGQEISLAAFDRWAEPLSENTTAVITDNLRVLLPGSRIVASRRQPGVPAIRELEVIIRRFDGRPGTDITLQADWIIRNPADSAEIATGQFTCTESIDADSYDALVAAMSRALFKLCWDLAVAHAAQK